MQWVNPFTRRIRVSTLIRNHETAQAKVNDADGNPAMASNPWAGIIVDRNYPPGEVTIHNHGWSGFTGGRDMTPRRPGPLDIPGAGP